MNCKKKKAYSKPSVKVICLKDENSISADDKFEEDISGVLQSELENGGD